MIPPPPYWSCWKQCGLSSCFFVITTKDLKEYFYEHRGCGIVATCPRNPSESPPSFVILLSSWKLVASMKVWCHAGNPQVAWSILCKAPTPQHSAQGAISATMAFSGVCITNDQNDVNILDICKNMCCLHFDHGAYSWLKKVHGKMDVYFERLETVTNLHQIMPSKGSTRHWSSLSATSRVSNSTILDCLY